MISSSDIKTFLSVLTGSAGNSTAQANPNNSRGKYISTSEWAGAVLHDLFPVVTGRQNAAEVVKYRCIFVKNTHATLTLTDLRVHLKDAVPNGVDFAIGLDPAGVVAHGASSAQAAQIATENDAPAGVTFSVPADDTNGLAIGDLAPNYCRAIWVRLTATDSAPVNADGVTLGFLGDTAE
ncbi:MAG TPA: hypothetical protein VGH19_06675 [Verrucomicrobiae bacterium]